MRSLTRILDRTALVAMAIGSAVLLGLLVLAKRTLNQQFQWLAASFLGGRLDVPIDAISGFGVLTDFTIRDGLIYWPLGPLPALIFAPFIRVAGDWTHSLVQAAAVAAAFWLAYRLARSVGFGSGDSAWLMFVCVMGSSMIGVAYLLGPWYLGNLLTAVWLLAAIIECRERDRPVVIGIWLALAAATRITSVLGVIYFFVRAMFDGRSRREKLRYLAMLAVPLVFAAAALGAYNQARFGTPFDTGYGDSLMEDGSPDIERRASRGLFDIANVPGNLNRYFFNVPVRIEHWHSDAGSFSFFVLSPLFLLALIPRRESRRDWIAAMTTVGAQLALFLTYYCAGAAQFGTRFMAEVVPFLFLALLSVIKPTGWLAKLKPLIFVSVAVNSSLLLIFVYHFT